MPSTTPARFREGSTQGGRCGSHHGYCWKQVLFVDFDRIKLQTDDDENDYFESAWNRQLWQLLNLIGIVCNDLNTAISESKDLFYVENNLCYPFPPNQLFNTTQDFLDRALNPALEKCSGSLFRRGESTTLLQFSASELNENTTTKTFHKLRRLVFNENNY